MASRSTCVAMLLFLGATPACADPGVLDLHGLALGMTVDQATTAANLPCTQPPYTSELDCRDDSDGSNYQAVFSAGDPSVALSVQRSFCSQDSKEAVLKALLARLRVDADRAHRDPNGYHVDLDGNREAILNADDGTCQKTGGVHYIAVIRNNSLINASGSQAVERAKAALH